MTTDGITTEDFMILGDMVMVVMDITTLGEVLGDGTTGDTEVTIALAGVDLVMDTDGETLTTEEDITTLTIIIDITIIGITMVMGEILMLTTIVEEDVMTMLYTLTTEIHTHVLVDLT